MHFKINDAPQTLLNAISKYDEKLNLEVDYVAQKPKFSAWPDNVKVIQDESIYFYVRVLAKLLFNVQEINKESEVRISMLITWQARQAYRIINAAISSTQVNETLKSRLILIRQDLESSSEIKSLLDEIESSELKPDIVCSGHAGAPVESGYVQNLKQNTEIVLYSGVGSLLSDFFGVAIENQLSHLYYAQVFDRTFDCSFSVDQFPFPKVITAKSIECVPNFNFVANHGENKKARIIEYETGRILAELTEGCMTNLEDIVCSFPNRRIHWSTCAKVFRLDDNGIKSFGPYYNFTWEIVGKKKEAESKYYCRFYQPKKMVNDALMIESSNYLVNK